MARFRAPGRVNLMGDHTDYNEGFVLPMAIDREAVVTVTGIDGGRVRISSAELAGRSDVAADGRDDPASAAPEWARLVAGVVRVLAARGRAAVGLEGRLCSTVPVGAGLSSSAAVEVACALALADAAALEVESVELALLCQEAEQLATGVPSGIMDQLASVGGVDGAALLIDCRTLALRPVPLPESAAVLVVDSAVPRTLERTAYAERRAACEAAAARLGLRALRDATEEQVRDDPIARHVVRENARVHQTAAALERGELVHAGELFRGSHESLRDDFRVSTPELDILVAELERAGAYGARMTGAGFGGAVVALCDEATVEDVSAAATRSYADRTGLRATAFRCRAVAGAGKIE